MLGIVGGRFGEGIADVSVLLSASKGTHLVDLRKAISDEKYKVVGEEGCGAMEREGENQRKLQEGLNICASSPVFFLGSSGKGLGFSGARSSHL